MTLWPCSNPDCAQPCTSLVLDKRGLCPSCSFGRTLDDIAAKRASRRPTIWDEDELAQPPVTLRPVDTALIYAAATGALLLAGSLLGLLLAWSVR